MDNTTDTTNNNTTNTTTTAQDENEEGLTFSAWIIEVVIKMVTQVTNTVKEPFM